MNIKKGWSFLLLCLSLHSVTHADGLGETLQINTHFNSIAGKPTWLLIVRDVTNGQVLPYLFDIRNQDNYWIAFTVGHAYRITRSALTFGTYASISNFCHLEDGIITGRSMFITLTGDLTPIAKSSHCQITSYAGNDPLPIATFPEK